MSGNANKRKETLKKKAASEMMQLINKNYGKDEIEISIAYDICLANRFS